MYFAVYCLNLKVLLRQTCACYCSILDKSNFSGSETSNLHFLF